MRPCPHRLLFQNAAGYLREQRGYLRVHYQPPAQRTTAAFAELLTHAGKALTDYTWHCLFNDCRLLFPLTMEEQDWLTQQWRTRQVPRPRALTEALILPKALYASLPNRKIYCITEHTSTVSHTFLHLAAAHRFFRHTPAPIYFEVGTPTT